MLSTNIRWIYFFFFLLIVCSCVSSLESCPDIKVWASLSKFLSILFHQTFDDHNNAKLPKIEEQNDGNKECQTYYTKNNYQMEWNVTYYFSLVYDANDTLSFLFDIVRSWSYWTICHLFIWMNKEGRRKKIGFRLFQSHFN